MANNKDMGIGDGKELRKKVRVGLEEIRLEICALNFKSEIWALRLKTSPRIIGLGLQLGKTWAFHEEL